MGSHYQITLVDDDESVRDSLPYLLNELGLSVRVFSSADDFLASDPLDSTECMMLDIAMPKVTGPQLWREMTRRGQVLPTIFITAQRDEQLRAHLLDEGAVDCLFKPFSDCQLRQAIEKVFA